MLANMCVVELYKIISQCFDMFGFKKKNLNFEHFSSLMMIPWYCGFCLNEHQCFDEKDEQYHFKLCSDINKIKRAIVAIKENTLTPLEKQKIIVNLKLSDNTDRLTLAVLKTELKKKKERNKTAFEDAYRRKQNKKSQLAHSRKTNSSKTKPNPRAGVNDNNFNDGEIQS